MTQKRLSELVRVSHRSMNAIENSKHAPTIDVAIRIADVFGVMVDQLFQYEYDGKPKRRSIDTKTTTVPKIASVERTIDDRAERASAEAEVENKISLMDLRNMF